MSLTEHNPVSSVEKLKVPKRSPRFLNLDEIDKLLEASRGSHIYPIVMTAIHTGVRKSELLTLQWIDIDFDQGMITVQPREDWHTKNYKPRTAFITPGLKGVTLHSLRHTFASQLALAGVPLRDIQELMGHQSFQTTIQYAHLTEEHVKKQVMRLPFAGASRESWAQNGHNVLNITDSLQQDETSPTRMNKGLAREGGSRTHQGW